MFSKESEDFVEVLDAWAKVIGVNLGRESDQGEQKFALKTSIAN